MGEADILQGIAAAKLIEYQPGTIVSKILVKSPSGTITVFAFDKGQELSEHTAPHDALVMLLDGEAEFQVSGKLHALKSGDALLMPARAPHAVKATQAFKMLLVMIRSE
ncbi:MAG: cupin domain-containing protein [Candidatus Eisenbacteria bacterium]|nr:cupin domain-containing protein [Candidatus Eisenbacteria bacterium]